jgi:hypothetical protein
MKLPKHISLSIQHNPHNAMYASIAEYADQCDYDDSWASPESKELAIRAGELWVIQWYPDTPVGFCVVLAHSLEAALEAANRENA